VVQNKNACVLPSGRSEAIVRKPDGCLLPCADVWGRHVRAFLLIVLAKLRSCNVADRWSAGVKV